MRIAFFGSSLVSSYWNGAATYYRGIVRALDRRGHRVTFLEPDARGRQERRDIDDPDWAEVVVYKPTEAGAREALARVRNADVIVKASGVGVLDELLEAAVARVDGFRVFWDVDAPATLTRLEDDEHDPLRALVPHFDLVLTYGGGEPVCDRYRALGAAECVPVYNALDPETHFPAEPDPRFDADLAFLGNRLPDREARVEEFLLRPAELLPHLSFLLAGAGWEDRPLPPNVRVLGHVSTNDHNAFNSTPGAVLNVLRESMAANGWSPATRIFEAAGAGACILSDAWRGIDAFLCPGSEVLVASSGDDVAALLEGLSPGRARMVGAAARRRVLERHTYSHRAEQLERILGAVTVAA